MTDNPFGSIALATDDARDAAASVSSAALKPIVDAYAKNIDTVLTLISMPLALLGIGIMTTNRIALMPQAIVNTRYHTEPEPSEETQRAMDNELERLLEEAYGGTEPKFSDPIEQASEKWASMMQDEKILRAAYGIQDAAISLAWTALESLAIDLWESALNANPTKFGQPVFSTLPSSSADGMSSRQISIGLLARHGFDLREKLGTVLAPKFDFTGVRGIRSAYSSAFGDISEIEEHFDSEKLLELEASRHLIVHRASIVDQIYLSRTNNNNTIGERITFDGESLSTLLNSSIELSICIMQFVDKQISSD